MMSDPGSMRWRRRGGKLCVEELASVLGADESVCHLPPTASMAIVLRVTPRSLKMTTRNTCQIR